jgi:hypothetical protein
MLNLALWLKKNNFRLDQVQTFLPTPMAIATAMYHSQKNPLRKVSRTSETVETVRKGTMRKLHKAFLRYHDPDNWPLLREALKRMGRADLIGNGKKQLIPLFQPVGTGKPVPPEMRAPSTNGGPHGNARRGVASKGNPAGSLRAASGGEKNPQSRRLGKGNVRASGGPKR